MTKVRSLPTSLKALAVAMALCATSAFADQLNIGTSAYSNGGSGGSYTISQMTGSLTNSSYSSLAILSAGTFESFCLEPTEYFNPGNTYDYTIGSAAVGGGAEAPSRDVGVGDQLSVGTAYLYSLFATGNLSNLNYTGASGNLLVFNYSNATRQTSNLSLQAAIWWLEDETQGSLNAAYTNVLTTQFGSVEAARANATYGQFGVYAINITSNNGTTQNQSQTYYHVPDSGNAVILLGSSLLALAAVRRSRRRRA